jgi:DMSO/TMAO reductase YedYZ molybdopterin-dependent catalytic subunit
LTPEILAKLPRVSVRVTLEKGGMATYEGVALSDILARAGVRFGQALHGGGIARYLKVDAADRYQVVFALAELDTAYASRVVLLADRKDGRPLPEPEGPLEVIVPGEKIRARWVWKVSALTVESAR